MNGNEMSDGHEFIQSALHVLLRATQQHPDLAVQLQATLNVIPAFTWYASPSGALTFMNKQQRTTWVCRTMILSGSG